MKPHPVNDGSLRTSARSIAAKAIFGTVLIVFAFDLILPVFLAALFRTDTATAFGRLGFVSPVLVIADSESRRLILIAAAGSLATAFGACAVGTGLGLATAWPGGLAFRASRFLTLLPGRMPTWVIPACFAACSGGRWAEATDGWALAAWLCWVAWWGATRAAEAFGAAVASVPREEWDAAQTLGRSTVTSLRTVLAPRLGAKYFAIVETVALVTLLDPSAVLFLGLRHWPTYEVFRLIRQADVQGATQAASWLVWLILIAAGVGLVARLVFGKHARVAIPADRFAGARSSLTPRACYFPSVGRFRPLAFVGAWPFLTLGGVLIMAAGERRLPAGEWVRSGALAGNDALFVSACLNGLLFAVSMAFFGEILARWGDNRLIVRITNEIVSRWSVELAICGIAIGATCSTGLGHWLFPKVVGVPVVFFWSIALSVFVIANQRRGNSNDAQMIPELVGAATATHDAAYDSALTLGLPRRRAEALARRAGRFRVSGVSRASLASAAWWLWICPAWAFSPMWRASTGPTGGQLLAERFLTDQSGARFAAVLGLLLTTSALFALTARLAHGRPGNRSWSR